jgi:hyperosmotically inducible periplasmic protein
MKPLSHRPLAFAAAFAFAAVVAACGDRSDDTTTTQRSDAASRNADGGRDLKGSASRGVDAARGKLGEAGQAAGSGTSGSTSVMGAAGDAREKAYSPSTGEAKADDSKLTSMVLAGLKADKELNPLRIDVDTRDGVVTLSGSVPTAAAKARASEIAQNVKNVKSVNNQLTLAAG